MTRRCLPLGDNADAEVDRLVAEGVLTDDDADAAHDFAEFLRDSATARCGMDDTDEIWTLPTWVLWKHRSFCCLTDDEVRDVARRRSEPDPDEEVPSS
jgi:hypothetical protein